MTPFFTGRRVKITAVFVVAVAFAVLQAVALRAHPASCPSLYAGEKADAPANYAPSQ